MSVWAYACRACQGDPAAVWYAPAAVVAEMPPDVRVLRVRVGSDWHCARVDRDHPVAVEQVLLRDVVASSADDCPACAGEPAAAGRPDQAPAPEPAAQGQAAAPPAQPPAAAPGPAAAARGAADGGGTVVQAAAISVRGQRLVVVLVPVELMQRGEGDMAIDALQPAFGGAPVVLLAQDEEGMARWHGRADLTELAAALPMDHMPWKPYRVG